MRFVGLGRVVKVLQKNNTDSTWLVNERKSINVIGMLNPIMLTMALILKDIKIAFLSVLNKEWRMFLAIKH